MDHSISDFTHIFELLKTMRMSGKLKILSYLMASFEYILFEMVLADLLLELIAFCQKVWLPRE